jgi:lipopolysaccharide transport system permease protein
VEAAEFRQPQTIEVTAGPGRLSTDSLRELWDFREVLTAFAVRYVKIRYKQAAIGVAWAILQPILSALVFALVLGHFAKVSGDGLPYLLVALTGMVGWTFFSSAVTAATQSVVNNQALVRKVYFPREVIPLGTALAGLLDLAAGLLVLFVFVFGYGRSAALSWLVLPVPLLTLVVIAAAVSLAFGALNVYYRDVNYAVPFLLQIGLFASAIVYPLQLFPQPFQTIWAVVNPVAGATDAFRTILLKGHWPDLGVLFGGLAWSLVLLFGAYALFKRLERAFADRA